MPGYPSFRLASVIVGTCIVGAAFIGAKATAAPPPSVEPSNRKPNSASSSERFAQKILELAKAEKPIEEAVSKIFGAALLPSKADQTRTEWDLSPSALLARGRVTRFAGGTSLVELVASESFTIERRDIENVLLDFPFASGTRESDFSIEGSSPTHISKRRVIFLVPAGELLVEEWTTVGRDNKPVSVQRGNEGQGMATPQVAFHVTLIGGGNRDRRNFTQTLREFRAQSRQMPEAGTPAQKRR